VTRFDTIRLGRFPQGAAFVIQPARPRVMPWRTAYPPHPATDVVSDSTHERVI